MDNDTKNIVSRIEQKVDKIDERLDNVDTHLAVYNIQLETHIKASKSNAKRLVHVENHVIKVNLIMKILGAVGLTIIGAAVKLYFNL